MTEFKLIEKLLYKSEENDIECEFIIGNETYGQAKKQWQKFLEQHPLIFQCISPIQFKMKSQKKKEVSISSKVLFKEHPEFIKKSLKKSNNR